MRRFVSSPLFLVAAACFFLPFITVACTIDLGEQLGGALGEDNPLAQLPAECTESTITGWHLVTNTSPDIPRQCLEGTGAEQQPDPSGEAEGRPWAIAAFAAAVLGIGLSLLPRPAGPILAVVLGVGGGILLLVTRATAVPEIPAQARPFVEVRTEYGLWLSLAFFVLAAAWGAFRLFTERAPAVPIAGDTGFGAPPPPGPPPPPTLPEEPGGT